MELQWTKRVAATSKWPPILSSVFKSFTTVFSGDHRETKGSGQLPPIIVGRLNSQEPEKSDTYTTLFTSFTFSCMVNCLEKKGKKSIEGPSIKIQSHYSLLPMKESLQTGIKVEQNFFQTFPFPIVINLVSQSFWVLIFSHQLRSGGQKSI